jgi:hypothetical protein
VATGRREHGRTAGGRAGRTADALRPGDSVESVYGRLRDLIVEGAYAPNERLTHAGLSRQLGAGRMSVRQALHRLEADLRMVGVARRGRRPGGVRGAGATHTYLGARRQALGERVVLWSVDPTDWSPGVTPRQIARRVLGVVRPGSIIILHDGGGDRSATIKALPPIVKGIRHRGLHLVEIAAR